MVAQGKKIPLKKDVPFKLFLSNNTPASQACLKFMLSAMTGRTVTEATVTNPELLPDFVGAKKPRMDINCAFDGGQRADIELQLAPDGDDQAERALYYACKLFSGALKEGELYKAAPFVYQIFLVDFDIFQDGEFFHHVMPSFRDGTVTMCDFSLPEYYCQNFPKPYAIRVWKILIVPVPKGAEF